MQDKGQTTADKPGGRGRFETAQNLYDFVGEHMPRLSQSRTSLTTGEYWAVVHYVVLAHGSAVPRAGLDAGNAKTVLLSSR
jgi:hypothetical protein